MRKRIKAVILTALLLLTTMGFAAPVMAAGTVTVSSVSGTKNELVDVQISLASDDVSSGNFEVCYDSTALELVEAIPTDSFQCFVNPYTAGRVSVSFMQFNQVITDDVLCTLTFRVLADTDDQSGSPIVLEQVKLYDVDGKRTSSSIVHGSVVRKSVRLSMSTSDTAEYQAVRAIVSLGGSLAPAGGNFSITYDPEHFTVKSVLPLEAMGSAECAYHIVEPGLVKIAFSNKTALEQGALCAVVFQTVGNAGASSALTISDAKMYNEDADPMDVSVVNGSLNIVVPSDDDPKLWVVGGALQEDGSAKTAVVLQGRGYACGGNFTITYDSAMTAEIEPIIDCQINHNPEKGEVLVSWAAATPFSSETEMLTIQFSGAIESTVTINDAMLYYDEGKAIPVVDIRPCAISTAEAISAVVDDVVVESKEDNTKYTVTVDVSDQNYLTENSADSVTTALALYQNGQMVGIEMVPVSAFSSGTNEIALSAETNKDVSDFRVFFMDDASSLLPLCQPISDTAPK